MSLSTFSYSQGGNKFSDLLTYINEQVVRDSTNPSITGSLSVTGSTIQFSQITIPSITAALPTATSVTGSLIVSGSGANVKLYFFNGVAWMTASMSTI